MGDSSEPLDQSVRDLVEERTGKRPDGPIRLLTNLAWFGYCINPISIYYCFDKNDERLETAWFEFLSHFDEAVAARIEEDQRQRLISELDAAAIARALNRLDAYSLIEAFGQHPRKKPGPTLGAIERIWISTLYDWRRRDGKTPLIRRSDELTAASE